MLSNQKKTDISNISKIYTEGGPKVKKIGPETKNRNSNLKPGQPPSGTSGSSKTESMPGEPFARVPTFKSGARKGEQSNSRITA